MSEAPEKDEIDQLMESIQAPSEGIPMHGEETPPAAVEPQAEPAPPQWNAQEWEFDWNGKKVAPDSRDKARTWMSQGYNYSQRMAEINAQRQAFERQRSEIETKYKGYDRYKSVDEYARQNPQWWEHVEKSWQERDKQQAQQLDPSIKSYLEPLQQKLQTLESWYEQSQQEKATQEQQRQDEALSAEIGSIRESHPNIDFDAVDQSGKTLEGQIIDHAVKIGTSSFKAAFRDYCYDQLLESAKAQNLSAQAKEGQAKKAAGILGTSPTPRKQSSGPLNVRGRSYDEIARMALETEGLS